MKQFFVAIAVEVVSHHAVTSRVASEEVVSIDEATLLSYELVDELVSHHDTAGGVGSEEVIS